MEQIYSKEQILETYLNNIPYGGTLYGIEAASEAYFGIPAKDLTLAEAAYLASMIQAPRIIPRMAFTVQNLIRERILYLKG